MSAHNFRVTGFDNAADQLRGRDVLQLCPNTRLIRRYSDLISVQYHDTDIVQYGSTGSVFLNSNGWRTSTTKQRINRCLPPSFHVFQKRGIWRVRGWCWITATTTDVVFEDGMELVK